MLSLTLQIVDWKKPLVINTAVGKVDTVLNIDTQEYQVPDGFPSVT